MNAGWHRVATAKAISLLTALSLSGQNPQAPVLLRMVPPEGQVSRYAMSMQTDVDSPMAPSSGPVMTMRIQQTQTVLGVEDEVDTETMDFNGHARNGPGLRGERPRRSTRVADCSG